MTMEPGTVYGNRYTLDELIAVGGMGEVWKATDKVLGRTVAIKLLSANLATQPGFEERFREEARHTALLSHPNIATVYDYGETDGASWLVMEFVEGEPLSAIIRDEGPKGIKPQIQGDELRVTGKSRDDLQEVIALLKGADDIDAALQFVNYR